MSHVQPDESLPSTMRALVVSKYGAPGDVLRVSDEVPTPASLNADQVLVKVHVAALNAGDFHVIRGTPFVIKCMFGCSRPKIRAVGSDFAGTVVRVGPGKAAGLKVGDRVFGDLSDSGMGAVAEYCLVSTKFVAEIVDGVSFHNAVGLPVAGGTALGALRQADVQPGEEVLIVGASGGVGHFAVQIAKTMGAGVTGVCSAKNVEMVKSLGADAVIDYTQEDYKKTRSCYDVILDCANDKTATDNPKLAALALKPGGRYVMVGGKHLFKTLFCGGCFARQAGGNRKVLVHMASANGTMCEELMEMASKSQISTHVDSVRKLDQTAIEGMALMDSGRARGKILVEVLPSESTPTAKLDGE